MNGYQIGVVCVAAWVIGVFFNAMVRFDCPQDDSHTALGKCLLWPLLVVKFIMVALVRGLKELFTWPE